jgi:predicted RNase H-like HicB family nuclease
VVGLISGRTRAQCSETNQRYTSPLRWPTCQPNSDCCSIDGGLPWRKMKKIIQVHIFRGESHFVAECLDLPVVTQGRTLDELAQNLREAIALQLEGENLADFGLADNPSILASFELEPLAHAET